MQGIQHRGRGRSPGSVASGSTAARLRSVTPRHMRHRSLSRPRDDLDGGEPDPDRPMSAGMSDMEVACLCASMMRPVRPDEGEEEEAGGGDQRGTDYHHHHYCHLLLLHTRRCGFVRMHVHSNHSFV